MKVDPTSLDRDEPADPGSGREPPTPPELSLEDADLPRRIGGYAIQMILRHEPDAIICRACREQDNAIVELHWRKQVDAAACIAGLMELVETLRAVPSAHLIRLLDAGVVDGFPDQMYLVVDHVGGRTLGELIRATPVNLEPNRVVGWADELAGAIDTLHTHDLMHGAIGMSTIMIDDDDHAHLGGIGIARDDRLARERDLLLGAGSEDATATGELDTYDDILALAATTYEVFAGERPRGRPRPVPGLSVQINMAMLNALSRDRTLHPSKAREMVQTMRGAPVRQTFQTPSAPHNPLRRNLHLMASVIAVALFGAGAWLFFDTSPRPGSPMETTDPLGGDGMYTATGPARLVPTGQTPLAQDPPVTVVAETIETPTAAALPATDAPPTTELPTTPIAAGTLSRLRHQVAVARKRSRRLAHRDHVLIVVGVTNADRMVQIARQHERVGRVDSAEATYRSALSGYRRAVINDAIATLWSSSEASLRGWASRVQSRIATARNRPPQPGHERVTTIDIRMVYLSPGGFQMGSHPDEPDRDPGETLHEVRITRGFLISRHEITRRQFGVFVLGSGYITDAERLGWSHGIGEGGLWRRIQGLSWRTPGFVQGPDHPVTCVSLHDAMSFCHWLTDREGVRYTLPTEAQWEYAARAGAAGPFHWGSDVAVVRTNGTDASWSSRFGGEPAWPVDDGYVFTAPVGLFAANAWGLFDVHGNVQEWCRDRFAAYPAGVVQDPAGPGAGSDDERIPRVLRGGSFAHGPNRSRSAHRDASPPGSHFATLGFRIVSEVQDE